GKELLEKPFPRWFRDSWAIIAHGDKDRALPLTACGNLDSPAAGCRIPHGIESIAHKIDERLLNLSGIAFNVWQISREGHLHPAKLCCGVRLDHVCDSFHHVV